MCYHLLTCVTNQHLCCPTTQVGNVDDFVDHKMPYTYAQLRDKRKYMKKRQEGKLMVRDAIFF